MAEKNEQKVDPMRRRLILGAVAAPLASLWIPEAPAQPTEQFWLQPRVLDLYRPVLRKRVRTVYWQNGQVNLAGYHEICHLLKDQRANMAYAMDLRLLDLLCAMQAWVRHYGYHDPIQVNSGYRTAQSNSRLEGAAKNSMHIQGKAADIVFPGLPTSYVGKLASHYAGGGVGFYYSSGFIHVDTGRRRSWVKR